MSDMMDESSKSPLARKIDEVGGPLPCQNKKKKIEHKGAIWVHVIDDTGANVKDVGVTVEGTKKKTDGSGMARFDAMDEGDHAVTLDKLAGELDKGYDLPVTTTETATVSAGNTVNGTFVLTRKAKLTVKVFEKKNGALFKGATVTVTGKGDPGDKQTALGIADYGKLSAGPYTVKVALEQEDAKGFFAPKDALDVNLVIGVDREVLVEAEAINVVTPKIEVEYKVVLLDRKLSAHKALGEDAIFADPTYIQVSFSETNADYPHEAGAKLVFDPADAVEVYTDDKCTTKLAADLTKDDLPKGAAKKLYLRGVKAGTFKVKLTLNDPPDKTKIKLDKNPAEAAMGVVELEVEAYSAKKAASKVLVDDSDPTHTKLSDEDKIKKGRLLVLQDGGRQGRAKVVVKKPNDILWTTGDADYEVHAALKATSGALALYDAETAGSLKDPVKLTKNDFNGGDVTFWAEGTGVTDDFRQAWLHLALDRPDRDLAKTVKACGDVARFTIVDIAKVTPDTVDYKQYVNLPVDVSHPEYGRELKSKAKLTKDLKDVELMFALVPDAGNEADLPDTVKHDKPKDLDVAVKTDVSGEAESAKLKFSIHGGDKFKVAVYALEAPPPKKLAPDKSVSKEIVIWRQLYYTMTCMKRADGSDYSDRLDEVGVQAKFESVFIKFTRTGGVTIKDFTSAVRDSGGVRLNQISLWNPANFPADADRTINIGLIEAQTSSNTTDVDRSFAADGTFNLMTRVSTETLNRFTFDLGAQADWLSSGTVEYENSDNPGVWTAIADNKATLTLVGLDHKLNVDLSAVVIGLVTVDKIKVKVRLKKLSEWSGDRTGRCVLVGMRWREMMYSGTGQVPDAVRRTTLHEIGHFLGLAPVKKGNAAQDANDQWYNNNNTGPHCNYLMSQCVMYHAFEMVWDPCAVCSASLKTRDLSSPPIDAAGGY
jgi:hypothetical protein